MSGWQRPAACQPFMKSYPWYMTLASFCDVSEQVWTGVRHSCRSLPPLCWTNNNIWGWYSGEWQHTKPSLKATLSHVQFTTGPDETCHASSVNRPVYTEEGTTASPRTEPPVWGGGGGWGSPLVSWDYLINWSCRTDTEILESGFTSCHHHESKETVVNSAGLIHCPFY